MKRNKFSLSHYNLLGMQLGDLVPIACMEVLPGDTFQHSTSLLIRMSPLVAPVMHPLIARLHHWFVPNRILWPENSSNGTGWERFITGGPDGLDASVYPTISFGVGGVQEGSLADYLGVPPNGGGEPIVASALPFRAYATIYNEYYRDQDLIQPVNVDHQQGTDTTTNKQLLKAAWEKDYFTSARPFTQKGPQITIPVGGKVQGVGTGSLGGYSTGTLIDSTGTRTVPLRDSATASIRIEGTGTDANAVPNITVDASVQIMQLRAAMALQRAQEARARYGSRYVEYLRYYGIKSSDARLQRPEYLGGGKQTIQFSEVLQTGPHDPTNDQVVGSMRGHGIGAMRSNRYRRFFEEHGWVLTLLSIKPRTMYPQGLARHWSRTVKEDFYQKELAHIGQQEIWNSEVFANTADPKGVWGYNDRYDEYRRQESRVSGSFRSTLDYWHMARIFSGPPVLNQSFVEANPTNRVFADQTGSDTVYVMASHSVQARRLLPKIGTSFIY